MNESIEALKAGGDVELQQLPTEESNPQGRKRGNSLAEKFEEFQERTHEEVVTEPKSMETKSKKKKKESSSDSSSATDSDDSVFDSSDDENEEEDMEGEWPSDDDSRSAEEDIEAQFEAQSARMLVKSEMGSAKILVNGKYCTQEEAAEMLQETANFYANSYKTPEPIVRYVSSSMSAADE